MCPKTRRKSTRQTNVSIRTTFLMVSSMKTTEEMIAEKYGFRLNTCQIAEVLGITKPALYNLQHGKRWCDYREIARHLDEAAALAA